MARMGLFLRQLHLDSTAVSTQESGTGREFLIGGIVLLVLGTLLAGWSGWLYHRTRQQIDERTFDPDRTTVNALVTVVVVGGIVIVGMVVWQLVTHETPGAR